MKFKEKDLQNLYGTNTETGGRKVLRYFLYVLYLVIGFSIIFALINFGTFKKRFDFWYKENITTEEVDNSPLIGSGTNQSHNSTDDIINVPAVPNGAIVIEKIDVQAPIVWDVPNTPTETESNLKNGVIHLHGTAKPGEGGNVFITGHSSDYFWSNGKYKEAFVLLDKLVVGDKIYINFNNVIYGYSVVEKKSVKPNDLSVLDQEDKRILSLMTCTPVGTALNRLIIVAEEFYKR